MEPLPIQISTRFNHILMLERQVAASPCWQELQLLNPAQADGLLMLLGRLHEDFSLLAQELSRCHEAVQSGKQSQRSVDEINSHNRRMAMEVAKSLIKLSPSGSPVMQMAPAPQQSPTPAPAPAPTHLQKPAATTASAATPTPAAGPSPTGMIPNVVQLAIATPQDMQTPRRKRGPKPMDRSHLYCHTCRTRETPEWRSGPDGPRTLCNACGLNWRSHRSSTGGGGTRGTNSPKRQRSSDGQLSTSAGLSGSNNLALSSSSNAEAQLSRSSSPTPGQVTSFSPADTSKAVIVTSKPQPSIISAIDAKLTAAQQQSSSSIYMAALIPAQLGAPKPPPPSPLSRSSDSAMKIDSLLNS